MAWMTSLPVSKDNVAEIVACSGARWKIRWKMENERFNVLKNHCHELGHNFGHGQRFLAMTLAALSLLAFAWYTVLELLEPPWRVAREAAVNRTSFFAQGPRFADLSARQRPTPLLHAGPHEGATPSAISMGA
jgi:hypothetical protein